jgi:serine/threonine-protein kinase RsbW
VSRIRFLIDSELGAASLVAIASHSLSRHAGFEELRAYEIELCVTEAVTNAIRHAYHAEPGHEVSVSLSIENDGVELEVCDQGTSMLVGHIKKLVRGDPDEGDLTDTETLAEGGRGLQIMHDLMDDVAYFTDGNGNHLRMVKRL